MESKKIELLIRALEREKIAREKAEELLDERASALYRINEKLVDQVREIEFLHSLASVTREYSSNEEAYLFFLNEVCKLTKWPVGHVYIPVEKEGAVILQSSKTWHCSDKKKYNEFIEISERLEFFPKVGLPGSVFSSKKILWIKNLEGDNNFKRTNIAKKLSLKTAVGIPIKIKSNIVAVAEFFLDKEEEKDAHRIQVIENGANQLGILLEKYQMQKELSIKYNELKQTQIQLIQSEKMASLGTIAAGIAHEVNNPLSFILSNTESLRLYFKEIKMVFAEYDKIVDLFSKEKIPEFGKLIELKKAKDIDYYLSDCDPLLEETLSGLGRVREIIQDLKTFSRVDEAETSIANINDSIKIALKVLSNELKYKVKVTTELNDVPEILCYPGQLTQVFTNFIINSIHAITEYGEIKISTHADTGFIQIYFSDNGKGMNEEVLRKIFTPFFTTKPTGKGTGLGLSISYGIIKKHNGTIEVESEEGIGTTFKISLPIQNNIRM